MRASVLICLIIFLAVTIVAITGCDKIDNKQSINNISAVKKVNKTREAMLKQTGLIEGAMWPTYSAERNELAYERMLGKDYDPWIFLRIGNREIKTANGNRPSLSKQGLYFMDNDNVMFKQQDKYPVSLGLEGISSVVASPDGYELLLDDPTHGEQSDFFLYDIQTKRRKEVISNKIIPPDMPGNVAWGLDGNIYFDAAIDGWYGIGEINLNDKELKPKRLLKDCGAPAITPDGKYLIGLNYFGNNAGDIEVYELKTMRKIAHVAPDESKEYDASFQPPITSLSCSSFAVTEEKKDSKTNGAVDDKLNIRIFKLLQ